MFEIVQGNTIIIQSSMSKDEGYFVQRLGICHGEGPDSFTPWTDSCTVWEGYPGFRNSTALKLQLQVMRNQLEGAW